MRLLVTDYSTTPDLCDAIRRYYTLLQMTFASNIYKLFETPSSQIMRMEVIQAQNIFGPGLTVPPAAGSLEVQIACQKCGTSFVVQARLDAKAPKKAGAIQFPADNLVKCPGNGCKEVHNLKAFRDQVEQQTGKPIITV